MQKYSRARGAGGVVAALVLLLASVTALASDDDAMRAVVLDYAEAWHTGDAERMAQVLHPAMLKRRVVTEVLSGDQAVQVMDRDTVLRATREGAGRDIAGEPLNLLTTILDHHGDMAVARVVSPLYVDYLTLVRWEGRWVVLAVLWGTVAIPGDAQASGGAAG